MAATPRRPTAAKINIWKTGWTTDQKQNIEASLGQYQLYTFYVRACDFISVSNFIVIWLMRILSMFSVWLTYTWCAARTITKKKNKNNIIRVRHAQTRALETNRPKAEADWVCCWIHNLTYYITIIVVIIIGGGVTENVVIIINLVSFIIFEYMHNTLYNTKECSFESIYYMAESEPKWRRFSNAPVAHPVWHIKYK